MVVPAEFPEIKLFALLFDHFGPPNGLITGLMGRPGGDPDGPFKWDYMMSPVPGLQVQIIRHANCLEVLWWPHLTTAEGMLKYLIKAIAEHPCRIESGLAKLEEYTLLLNPYKRHQSLVQSTISQLRSLNPVEPKAPMLKTDDRKAAERFTRQYRAYVKKCDEQSALNMQLVMESAYMAESLLNLVACALFKTEVSKSYDRIREFRYLPWKKRLKKITDYCAYIKSPKLDGDIVLSVTDLFELRNRLAHSFPDKEDYRIGNMWFHKSYPILSTPEPYHRYAHTMLNLLPSKQQAIDASDSAFQFCDYLLGLIDSDIRERVEFFVNSNPIGYNVTKGVYSVPFGQSVIIHTGFR